ncbi:VOC family protein [Antarctobacter jejuensis]|uniref:VOC family protein n=1 Tax=Antarctobacter jejuensis TaxID=1439938 RepID=UPI003FD3EBDE
MELGAFSVSLSVKDLAASQAFYGKLGFEPVGGAAPEGWLILRNGSCTLGLFQGMFEGNMLTFNPGWTAGGDEALQFDDIRAIQARLRDAGVDIEKGTPEDGEGPGHISLVDPDGNRVFIDQHVPAPKV